MYDPRALRSPRVFFYSACERLGSTVPLWQHAQRSEDMMHARTYAALALWLCGVVAGCGDGDNSNDGARQITPGFFIGETQSGEDLSIAVGSIRAIFFRCAGQPEYQRFDPPEPVAVDGSFAVDVRSSGITFVVSGEITNDDRIDGALAGNSGCHGTFVARRCDPRTQDCGDRDGDLVPNEVDPDPAPTVTPSRTPAGNPTITVSNVIATSTPAATRTPTPAATPSALCGNGVLDDGEECDKNAVDNSGCFDDVCTCEDFCGDAGGSLSCNADCTLNFSKCTAGDCTF